MDAATLFEHLDLNHDGRLSRLELHEAAGRHGWHWHEASLFALLDLFSIPGPLSKQGFIALIQQIMNDPMGVYGDVLLRSPHFTQKVEKLTGRLTKTFTEEEKRHPSSVVQVLERHASRASVRAYQRLENSLDVMKVNKDSAAILIIDPQKSFTRGAWMQSIGEGAEIDVSPIHLAFNNCALQLHKLYRNMTIMFTRCPFPPESYPWDAGIDKILDNKQLYFIKPGNSVLFPPTNGFQEWIAQCMGDGLRQLIVGGCTLNSCVRVSADQIQQKFQDQSLQVVVDLSLCGARLRNFEPLPKFDGKSAIESAVHQMKRAGVSIVRNILFE